MDFLFDFIRKHGMAGSIVVFVLLFLWFYPAFYTSIDEHEYLKNSFLLRQYSISTEQHELYCGGNEMADGIWQSSYPIGKSVYLIPFTFLPFDFIFLSGLLIHLINFILIFLILKRQRIPSFWSLVYLFLPVFQWSSRTLFPELNALAFLLLGYYFWSSNDRMQWAISGFAFGLAGFFRYESVFALLAFGLEALVHDRKKFLPLFVGGLAAVILLLSYNAWVYGSPFSTGYGSVSDQAGQGISSDFGISAITYMAILFIALPFSLWAVFRHKQWIVWAALTAIYIAFVSNFSPFWHFSFSWPLTFTARLRYFIPLLGLLLIPTIAWLEKKRNSISISSTTKKIALIGLALLVIGGSLALHSQHQELLKSRSAVAERIHSTVPLNAQLIGSADDCIYFLPEFFGKYYYTKVDERDSNSSLIRGTYLIQLSYASQQDKTSIRQLTVDKEHQKMNTLIENNIQKLERVVSYTDLADLNVWVVR